LEKQWQTRLLTEEAQK